MQYLLHLQNFIFNLRQFHVYKRYSFELKIGSRWFFLEKREVNEPFNRLRDGAFLAVS